MKQVKWSYKKSSSYDVCGVYIKLHKAEKLNKYQDYQGCQHILTKRDKKYEHVLGQRAVLVHNSLGKPVDARVPDLGSQQHFQHSAGAQCGAHDPGDCFASLSTAASGLCDHRSL